MRERGEDEGEVRERGEDEGEVRERGEDEGGGEGEVRGEVRRGDGVMW